VEVEDEIEITQTDEPSASSPHVNERGSIVDIDMESPPTTDSPAVDHNSVAQEEIEEIVEEYQVTYILSLVSQYLRQMLIDFYFFSPTAQQ